MVYESSPPLLSPCAPDTRRVCPPKRRRPSGSRVGRPNPTAAASMVPALDALEATSPEMLGNNGKSPPSSAQACFQAEGVYDLSGRHSYGTEGLDGGSV